MHPLKLLTLHSTISLQVNAYRGIPSSSYIALWGNYPVSVDIARIELSPKLEQLILYMGYVGT